MAVNGWQAVLVLLEGLSEVRHLHSAAPFPVKCIEDRLEQEDVRLDVPGSESGERGSESGERVSRLGSAQVSGAKRTVLSSPHAHSPSSLSWLSRPPSAGSAHCVSRLQRQGGVVRHGVAGGVRQGRPSPRRRRVSSLLRSEDAWLSSAACSRACRASTGFEFGAESLQRALRSSSCAPSFRRPGESF